MAAGAVGLRTLPAVVGQGRGLATLQIALPHAPADVSEVVMRRTSSLGTIRGGPTQPRRW